MSESSAPTSSTSRRRGAWRAFHRRAAAALARFEEYTKYRDFKRFHIQQAIGFKSGCQNMSVHARVND